MGSGHIIVQCTKTVEKLLVSDAFPRVTSLSDVVTRVSLTVFFLCFTENENLAFRGNTIATKAVEAHMKLVGEKVGANFHWEFYFCLGGWDMINRGVVL